MMKPPKKPCPTNLSPDVVEACRVRGVRQSVKNMVKSVLCWGITLTILFVTAAQNPIFTPRAEPFWFSVVFLILVAFPFLKWKPYRIFFEREFRGTLVSYRNKRVLDSTENGARGIRFNYRQARAVDVYIIRVQDENGRKRTFTIRGENTAFGRVYYKTGDVLRCPRFAYFPFNESRPLPRPFCLWCGSIGSPNETECITCRAPYALVPENGTFIPAVSDIPVEKPKKD